MLLVSGVKVHTFLCQIRSQISHNIYIAFCLFQASESWS